MPRRLAALIAGSTLAVWPVASVGAVGFDAFAGVQHIVVIYEENHSFDNLYGGWEGVKGLGSASSANTTQIAEGGAAYGCLMQNDVNLASPPQPVTCTDSTSTFTTINSNFGNAPFTIDNFIAPTDTTCPVPGSPFAPHGVLKGSGQPGGCTADIVHRFYQEQYQLNGGAQNRYVTGSDAVGLAMGVYDTRALPIYAYLHQDGHPHYAIADNFFQAAFGGSFLNHQFLVAARAPVWLNALNDGSSDDLHSVVDANGMPNNYPLYRSLSPVKDQQLTASCSPGPGRGPTPPGVVCGDYAVNTTQPFYQPYAPGTALNRRLPPQTAPTIGDRLSATGVDWAWYSGGWSNADGDVNAPGWTNGSTPGTCTNSNTAAGATYPNCPDKLFQYHHQALNYFASFAPGTAARAQHLRDEAEFTSLAQGSGKACNLKPVSFVKPIGAENEHPGYTNETSGSNHLVSLLSAIESGPCAKNTMVVVTYDEFGGQWDHVTPPGQGGKAGVHDGFGPGTRVPALVITTHLRGDFVVDDTAYDTTSVLATIEHRFGLAPLTSRDAAVNDLTGVYSAHAPEV